MQKYSCEGRDSFAIHRLVRLFVQFDLKEDGLQTWDIAVNRALKGIHSYIKDLPDSEVVNCLNEPDDRQLGLLLHTVSIVQHCEERSSVTEEEEILHIRRFILRTMSCFGSASEVQAHIERLIRTFAKQGLYSSNRHVSGTLAALGIILLEQGKLDQAEMQFDRIVNLRQARNSYLILSMAYEKQEKLQQAEKMYDKSLEKGLAMHRSVTPHSDVAESMHRLGNIYLVQGKLSQAETMCEKTLKLNLDTHGTGTPHPLVASSYLQMGRIYMEQGNLEQAENMFMKSKEMKLDIYVSRTNQSVVFSTRHQLANLYFLQGKMVKAEKMFEEILEMGLSVQKSSTSQNSVALSYQKLGALCLKQRKLKKAVYMYMKSYFTAASICGSDCARRSDFLSFCLGQLGIILEARGKLDEALDTHVIRIRLETEIYELEKPHISVADAIYHFGLFLGRNFRKEALPLLQYALNMYHGLFGAESQNSRIEILMKYISEFRNRDINIAAGSDEYCQRGSSESKNIDYIMSRFTLWKKYELSNR